MKICYLADAESIHTQRWMKYFADKGHEVHLITRRHTQTEGVQLHIIKSVHLHFLESRIENRYFAFLLELPKVRRIIKTIKPDLLHSHYIGGSSWLGALSGFHPFVITAWGSDVLVAPKKSMIAKLLVRYSLKTSDLITYDAEHIKKPLLKLGVDPRKSNTIFFGVDTLKFKPKQRNKDIQERLGIFDSPIVISLRSLKPLYDIKSLIASIPLVLKKVPKTKFVIAGRGHQENMLKNLAKSLGVFDSVKFVGQIPNDELPKYLTSSDVYVSTSLSDAGVAASTAEAMACGLPVIITDFGDNRKWVEDGVNGFIIPLKDPKSLAERIIYLLKNEDIRKEFGKRNRKIIEERNNYYKEMKKMENIYKELVERYKL